MSLEDIEKAFASFKTCPRCHSFRQFWVGVVRNRPYVQCRNCGTRFEPFEVFKLSEERKESAARFFRE